MSNEFERAHEAYRKLREGGLALLDMKAVEDAIVRGAGGDVAAQCVTNGAFYDGKGTALALRGILGAILPNALAETMGGVAFPVSTAPHSDPVVKRAGRLLSMVHELHKAGYQRLRICAGRSADGSEWRCHLVPSSRVLADGWTPLSAVDLPLYSSGHGKRFFGWDDAEGDDARLLAVKFLERFPDTVREAAGQDWLYAGWLTSVLGAIENGVLPSFYGGIDFCERETRIPVPPGPGAIVAIPSGGGEEFISNEALASACLPYPGADYERLWSFCLTYDGYRRGLRTIDDCFAVAAATLRDGLGKATLERLRTTAFIYQRKIKNNSDMPPDPDSLQVIRDVVEEIRRRLRDDRG